MDANLLIQSIENRVKNGVVGDTDKVLEALIRCNIHPEVNATAQGILQNRDLLFDKGNIKPLINQLRNLLDLIERINYKKAANF